MSLAERSRVAASIGSKKVAIRQHIENLSLRYCELMLNPDDPRFFEEISRITDGIAEAQVSLAVLEQIHGTACDLVAQARREELRGNRP
ncbi:hypothetical protein CcrC1_gp067c [Caulobacter phage C1]|nr:hypothetical protein CcrC1_gp067c [Caulobacter phage C1]UTU08294.1 hypothetical protein CcrC2_gp066c [Caulobacter phage C2]UTU08817.1 hypothetical protein CcrJ4_gp066c [Caulobacter phage J4]UTU09369.1 hypothetical protein CcrBL47_gp083c [Caulobacter phage BL47]UTU09929.1 hypothetical protein CcrRB23_gp067c [Caulobacter phage RB23]WGN96954.1 hypothetical protein [Bertelyvirus sp.]